MKPTETPLKLRAFDLQDLSVLSSLVQDALVPPMDMTYLRDEQRFVLALNRFRWEVADDGPPYSRTHSGLRFDNVASVSRKGIDRDAKDQMLDLLAIAFDPGTEERTSGAGTVVLQFAGDIAVRLAVTDLAVGLKDMGEPWPTQWKPGHEPSDD